MKKAKPYLSRQLLINIYYTIVKPHFDYSSTVWDSIDMTLADQLQKLQNRAARIITGAPYRTVHTCDVFSDLYWSTLARTQPQSSESYNDAQNYEWKLSFISI